jgi:hypothetical protein
MSYNRFRVNSSHSANSSEVPSTGSSRRFRLSQAIPAPTIVNTDPASPVPSGIPMLGATRSLSFLIEDSDTSSSITSFSLESNNEEGSPVVINSSQPEELLDRSIPTSRISFANEDNFPVYSTVRTTRYPLLPVVQANVIDYDTACRYNRNN